MLAIIYLCGRVRLDSWPCVFTYVSSWHLVSCNSYIRKARLPVTHGVRASNRSQVHLWLVCCVTAERQLCDKHQVAAAAAAVATTTTTITTQCHRLSVSICSFCCCCRCCFGRCRWEITIVVDSSHHCLTWHCHSF